MSSESLSVQTEAETMALGHVMKPQKPQWTVLLSEDNGFNLEGAFSRQHNGLHLLDQRAVCLQFLSLAWKTSSPALLLSAASDLRFSSHIRDQVNACLPQDTVGRDT